MHYYEVATLIQTGSDYLTYESEISYRAGAVVEVPIGKKISKALVIREVSKPNFATKSIGRQINDINLPEALIKLLEFISHYYGSPTSQIVKMIVPNKLEINRRKSINSDLKSVRKRTHFLLNKDQSRVIKTILEGDEGSYILQGVTGSGKTEVYLQLIKDCLEHGRSALLLLPEIALTSQIISDALSYFDNNNILVFHSSMTEAERFSSWQKALNNQNPFLIIGARSALFAPVNNIGVIILDEAHETAYNQNQTPRYSALRAAAVLGKYHGAKVVYGSATPLISERYLAKINNRPVLYMNQRAVGDSIRAEIKIIDLRDKSNLSQHRFLSNQLIASIKASLDNHEQILIYHNRRGSSGITICENCGWRASCPNCFIPLVLHTDKYELNCKLCTFTIPLPTYCPECQQASIVHKSIGTKQIENELKRLFPTANIARFDSDNIKSESLTSRYKELYDGSIDIAIGTQIVAKGLDLPKLHLVGIIQADTGLSLPDYTSSERTFQLLYQVSGRVGRNKNRTQVIVQTYQPDNPSIKFGTSQDYESFYKQALNEREVAGFPPFKFILKATCTYKTENGAIKASQSLIDKLRHEKLQDIEIQGPFPAFYEKLNGNYRWQILVKSSRRSQLVKLAKIIPTNNWQIEIDTTSLL